MIYKNEIEKYVTIMNGKSFIKSISYLENQATLFISFYSSFEEYKLENPNSETLADSYHNYFSKSKIEKLLIEDTARLLMVVPAIQLISVTLQFDDVSYDVNISREEINSLIGVKLEELSPDDGSWQRDFVNIYTAGVKNEKRKLLLDCFLIKIL